MIQSRPFRVRLGTPELHVKLSLVPDWSALPAAAPSSLALPPAEADEVRARVERVEQIAARHLAAAWRTARELGVAAGDLEDVVQEALLVCVRRLSDIEPERERAFLLATTARVAANWRRSRRRRPVEPLDEPEQLFALAREGGAEGASPSRALEHKRELELVQAALEQMTEPQRVAFTLFELEELTAHEIAEQLGTTESVVFARVARARAVFHRHVASLRAREGKGLK